MFDYHIHTNFSDDCMTPMDEMIKAAVKKGVRELAITDHYDPDYPDINFPFEIDFPKYHQKLTEVSETYKNKIKILKGIEIGIQHGDTLKKCELAAKAFPYDIVLGAFHSACSADLYCQYFKDRNPVTGIMDYYLYMAGCLKEFKDFDVLGHINVIDRYAEFVPDYAPYMEIIESILKGLIHEGKGIEINASSHWYGMGERTLPSKEILTLYKALGGEIITIGSDAHTAPQVGYAYQKAVDMLISHGFLYVATFEDRKVNFVKI